MPILVIYQNLDQYAILDTGNEGRKLIFVSRYPMGGERREGKMERDWISKKDKKREKESLEGR